MPEYPWFFDGSPDKPNERGLALMTYVQWLGSWLESYPYYEDYEPSFVDQRRHREESGPAMSEPTNRRASTRRSQVITTIIFALVILVPSFVGLRQQVPRVHPDLSAATSTASSPSRRS